MYLTRSGWKRPFWILISSAIAALPTGYGLVYLIEPILVSTVFSSMYEGWRFGLFKVVVMFVAMIALFLISFIGVQYILHGVYVIVKLMTISSFSFFQLGQGILAHKLRGKEIEVIRYELVQREEETFVQATFVSKRFAGLVEFSVHELSKTDFSEFEAYRSRIGGASKCEVCPGDPRTAKNMMHTLPDGFWNDRGYLRGVCETCFGKIVQDVKEHVSKDRPEEVLAKTI